ncbi:MAG: hypothetical protein DDT25_00369 [Chloroflexi bacterium]|nr:hypothetical protein [Chloroflexota bacterium]
MRRTLDTPICSYILRRHPASIGVAPLQRGGAGLASWL